MKYSHHKLHLAICLAFASSALHVSAAETSDNDVERVSVTADYRQITIDRLPGSASVVSNKTITERNAEYLEQLLNITPNVNVASGASRGRFIQIRGIGERSQFREPINPSVGFIIDDIDLSGIASLGTLFDVQQVEVLRGPQGTQYGSSAMAGLVKLKTFDPTEEWTGKALVTLGNYGTQNFAGAVGGSVSDDIQIRVSANQFKSNGFIENTFLNSDDTAHRDEITSRLKLHWQASENSEIIVNWHHFDIDNGYDNFSLDNDRNTRSDQPGKDTSLVDGVSAKWIYSGFDSLLVTSTISYTDAEFEYSYDEDWTFDGFHPDGYSSFDQYLRNKQTTIAKLQAQNKAENLLFGKTQWSVGLWYRNDQESLRREYTYADGPFTSNDEVTNYALFAHSVTELSEKLHLTAGLRIERRKEEYSDNTLFNHQPTETMLGGNLSLDYQWQENTLVYGLLSRGYKAGGVNADTRLDTERRTFDSETVWNTEFGIKHRWPEAKMQLRVAAFLMQRDDQQLSASAAIPNEGNACPCSFIDFIDNSASGNNQGLEAELNWQASDDLQVFGALGLLKTEFKNYIRIDGTDLSGREQAHAPSYTFHLGANYSLSDEWFLRAEVEGRDKFYFSDSHEQQSDSYAILNASLGYQFAHGTLTFWAKNLTDKDYYTRGFGGFGNDPRDGYTAKPYYQLADPRQFGVTLSYQF